MLRQLDYDILLSVVTHYEDGHEAGQSSVPVTAGSGRGLSHQHAVKDEISQAQFHAP